MKKEEIHPWDFQRILFGQAPGDFLLEVFIRAVLMYLLLIVVLRLLGKRMDGQLTLTELAVMITLGAIIAVPMQIPDRGIVLGVIALLCVLAFQRGLNWLTLKSAKFEELTQGTLSIMVKDGVLQLDEMMKAGVSRQAIYSGLRKKEIYNLGKIKRLYFEACGILSVYQEESSKPGLSILPPTEKELMKSQATVDKDHLACSNCGAIASARHEDCTCQNCGERKWIQAVL
jgi:uncharacterized membrane protein YcaP (DUF421 family)